MVHFYSVVHTHAHIYTHTNTRLCTHIHTHTYVHTNKHGEMCTRMCILFVYMNVLLLPSAPSKQLHTCPHPRLHHTESHRLNRMSAPANVSHPFSPVLQLPSQLSEHINNLPPHSHLSLSYLFSPGRHADRQAGIQSSPTHPPAHPHLRPHTQPCTLTYILTPLPT